jgi:hypothetical protein
MQDVTRNLTIAVAARTAAETTAVLLTCAFISAAATAQTPPGQSPPAAEVPSSPPAEPSAEQVPGGTGMFDWMQRSGQMMQQGVTNMGTGFNQVVGAIGGQANQATRDAAAAAREAATSVSKLPKTGITTGNERCVVAPNGAPDCGGAAATLCRARGFAGGSSVDFVTVEICPPPWRTSPRSAPEGACTMEHYVTKALCQ